LSSTGDRYEPLPGLLSIPAFLVRRLGPRGRRVLAVVAAVALVGAVAAALILVPQITQTKRDNAERARHDAARALAQQRARLIAEQRPHRGSAPAGSGRVAIVAELQSAILADARSRVSAGNMPGPPAKRVTCEPLTHRPDGYRCLAVTSDLPDTGTTVKGTVGHPFAAVVNDRTGRFTWCKVSGRPGELSIQSRFLVKLPRVCGG
jgi:type II secretory pathway pseudopilin PulG